MPGLTLRGGGHEPAELYYDAWEQHGIYYGGLVELMVNAMVDAEPGYIDWEWH